MSGHSKWSKIKRKKGETDAKRSKIFSKIIKEITVAVNEDGSDADSNPRLRLAIANAKGANMPKDNVLRAINKAGKESGNYQEVTYEGYAPNGVGIFIECTTDNTQRTISNIRSYFNKHNGNLVPNGSLSFIFSRKGIFTIPKENIKELNEDDFVLEIIDAGAENVETEEQTFTITTEMENFGAMMKKLEIMDIEVENAQLQRISNTTVKLDKKLAIKVLKLIDIIEDDDDVQTVYHNLELC